MITALAEVRKAKGKAQRAKVSRFKSPETACGNRLRLGPFGLSPFAFCALPFAFPEASFGSGSAPG